ncbi:hypothetical protein ACFE04_016788 [Oxalis oulophora]
MASFPSLQFLCSSKKPHFLNIHSNNKLFKKHPSQVMRSQLSRDEGKSAGNIVDANLNVLRERISEARKKEIDCCNQLNSNINGWNYEYYNIDRNYRDGELIREYVGLIGFVGRALGLVFLSGSLSICLVSLLVHQLST